MGDEKGSDDLLIGQAVAEYEAHCAGRRRSPYKALPAPNGEVQYCGDVEGRFRWSVAYVRAADQAITPLAVGSIDHVIAVFTQLDRDDVAIEEPRADVGAVGLVYSSGGNAVSTAASAIRESISREAPALKTAGWDAGSVADVSALVRGAMQRASSVIHAKARTSPRFEGMCTTASVVLVANDLAVVGQVGDSRVYLARGEGVHQLTEDPTPPRGAASLHASFFPAKVDVVGHRGPQP